MPNRPLDRIRAVLAATLRVLTWLYLAAAALALVALALDPVDDPLAAVFLVALALPWTPFLGEFLMWLGDPSSLWIAAAVICLGIVANTAILLVIGWLLRRVGGGAATPDP